MHEYVLGAVFFALTASVGLILIVEWWNFRSTPPHLTAVGSGKAANLPLFVTTMSYAFFLLSYSMPHLLGPDYSSRRYAVIGFNCALAVTAFIVSIVKIRSTTWRLTLSTLALIFIWLIVGAISSAA